MRKFIFLATLVCMVALNVNAQTEETETRAQRYLRLSKAADENPTDWKTQLEVGHILLDKDGGFYNQSRAVRYFERIFNLATAINKEIPDSVIREAGIMLMTTANEKKNINKALYYIDELKRARNTGVDIEETYLNVCDMYGAMLNMAREEPVNALLSMKELRERVTKAGLNGVEYSDAMTSLLFDEVVMLSKKMFGDKLLELTLDGKKYVYIALGDWNIEKPFIGWTSGITVNKDGEEGPIKLAYGEDGVVYDELHGQMDFGIFCNKDGVVPQKETNVRLITVTPEQRQKMVEAYHKYMKKAKKQ